MQVLTIFLVSFIMTVMAAPKNVLFLAVDDLRVEFGWRSLFSFSFSLSFFLSPSSFWVPLREQKAQH